MSFFTKDIQPPEQGLNPEPPAGDVPPAPSPDSTQEQPPPAPPPSPEEERAAQEELLSRPVRVIIHGNRGEFFKGSIGGERFRVPKGVPVTLTGAQFVTCLRGTPHTVLE